MSNDHPITMISGMATAGSFVALNTASVIIRLLCSKGLISREEAATGLSEIAKFTREDAEGLSAHDQAEMLSSWLDDVAQMVIQPSGGGHTQPALSLVPSRNSEID